MGLLEPLDAQLLSSPVSFPLAPPLHVQLAHPLNCLLIKRPLILLLLLGAVFFTLLLLEQAVAVWLVREVISSLR